MFSKLFLSGFPHSERSSGSVWNTGSDAHKHSPDSADDHVFQDLDLGILLVEREGAVSPSSLHLNPASFKIVIEGEVVMKSIKDLPKAMCLLFGLTYALHLSYPKPMKNTFQFIQQVLLMLGHTDLKPRLH
ncbi:Venom metalloproteinase 3 [Labeo rohita]|uniref:Venom metalloproteinase 3 n=1 Tax=Labeo rohita TaxID=84645 RepID=A0ABQ8M5Q0_LABRO|nr:Venom metalloproteinase 3 [Labeo rohita]